VLGVCKAYTTRVGSGPFPTELLNKTGEWIREQGNEYGTVTGRGRRCGWLDLVVLRHAARLNSLSGFVVTRLDVLSGLEKLQVATGYKLDGKLIHHVPSDIQEFSRVEPVLEEVPGWSGDLRACRKLSDLPLQAQDYLNMIEKATGTPVAIASVGPDREETVMIQPDLAWPS
jgi:adenylosuccinate synthase